MAILVTGGAGYIGSHIVYALMAQGREAVVVDNLQTGHVEAVHPSARFERGDIRDEGFLDGILKRHNIEAVIHFAANSLVGESMAKPLMYYDNNFYGTLVLLKSLVKHEIGNVVFSSTAATYGAPERVPILESDPTNPTNTYGETKLAMEKMFKWTNQAGGPRFVSLRYFNACGAHASGKIGEDHKPESHLIPIVLQVANGQRPEVTIYGEDYRTPDGTCVRDYIHVMDLAQAHIAAVDYLLRGGKSDVFNLGNGVGFSVREVVEMCRKVTGHAIPAKLGERRLGDPDQLVASSEKARAILGFDPRQAALEEIVASAWNWHRSHPRGFA